MAFSILQRQKDINEAVKIKESINNEIIMKLHKILSKKYNLSRADYILLIDKYQLQKNKNVSRKNILSMIKDLKINKSFLEKTNTKIKYDKIDVPIMNDKLFTIHTRTSGLNKSKTKRNNYISYEDTVTRDLKIKPKSEIKIKVNPAKLEKKINNIEKKENKYDNIEEYEKKNLDDELKKLLENRKYDDISGLNINSKPKEEAIDYKDILEKNNLGSVYNTKKLPETIRYKIDNQVNNSQDNVKINTSNEQQNIKLNIEEKNHIVTSNQIENKININKKEDEIINSNQQEKKEINLILNLINNKKELKNIDDYDEDDNNSIIDDLDINFENDSIFNDDEMDEIDVKENSILDYINDEKNTNSKISSDINYNNKNYIENISEIKLLNCYINSNFYDNNFSNYPFIIIKIDQFKNTLAINNTSNSGFCQLFFEKKGNNYHFTNNSNIFGIYTPKNLVKIENIDVQFFAPNGKLINIEYNDNDLFNLVLKFIVTN